MDTKVFCVYNLTRAVFLSSKVTVADCASEPLKVLKVLVSGLGLDAVSGLWLSPLWAVPAVPRPFPFDLLYLDRDHQVVDAGEIVPGVEFPPFHHDVASALVLAHQTLQSTQTAPGDQLIIGLEAEIERQIGAFDTASTGPVGVSRKPFGNGHRELIAPGRNEAVATADAVFSAQVSSAAIAGPESGAVVAGAKSGGVATGEGLVETNVPEIPTKAANNDGKSPTEAKAPVIAITEVLLERPSASVVNGQHGGIEDLFSNWVDVPLPPLAGNARNSASPASKIDGAPAPTPPQEVESPAAVAETHAPREEKPQLTAAREEFAAATEAGHSKKGKVSKQVQVKGAAPVTAAVMTTSAVSDQTRMAIPLQPLSATFTVAQYGLWRASAPAAVSPVVAVERPFAERPAASSGDIQSINAGKTASDTRQAAVAKVPDLKGAAAETLKNGIERLPERIGGSAGQTSAAKAPVAIPDKAEIRRGEVSAAETVDRGARSAEAVEKRQAESKEKPPTKTAALKQPDDKEPASTPQRGVSLTLPLPGGGKPEQKEKLKISTQRVDANGKAKDQPLTLGMRFKRWLNPVAPTSSDRRRAYRRYVPGMVAHYYTGGAPKPHDVADISMTGFYLLTEDRWMPETMIQMTLQKPCAKGERKQSITVLSKIVRRGSDGVAAEFVMPESLDPRSHDVQPTQATDRFALARFI